MLAKYVSSKKEQWGYYIDSCVFAYNTSRQEATKHTPFSLMFCRQPNLPIDIEMQSESVEELVKHYDEIVEPDHGEKFKEHISTLQEVAKNIKVAQIKYKKQYDKKHAKPSEFYIGQLVLKKDFTRKKTKGGKLSCRYVGPFTITRVKSRGVYELCSDDGKVTSATGGHLKVYRKPLGSNADHSSNPTHTSEDDGSLSNDGSISADYRSTADDHFPLNGKIIIWCLNH